MACGLDIVGGVNNIVYKLGNKNMEVDRMKDKEKQIEEMAKHGCYDGCASGLRKFCEEYDGKPCKNMVRIASGLFEQNYRKLPKDSVALTKSELEQVKEQAVKEFYTKVRNQIMLHARIQTVDTADDTPDLLSDEVLKCLDETLKEFIGEKE